MPHSLPPGPITVERPRAPRPDPLSSPMSERVLKVAGVRPG